MARLEDCPTCGNPTSENASQCSDISKGLLDIEDIAGGCTIDRTWEESRRIEATEKGKCTCRTLPAGLMGAYFRRSTRASSSPGTDW